MLSDLWVSLKYFGKEHTAKIESQLKISNPQFKKNFFVCNFMWSWASVVAQMVKNLRAMPEIWVWSLSREDPLEKEMATHSSILAWRIPWTEEPGRLQSMGSQRVGYNWATNTHKHTHTHTHTHTVWNHLLSESRGNQSQSEGMVYRSRFSPCATVVLIWGNVCVW